MNKKILCIGMYVSCFYVGDIKSLAFNSPDEALQYVKKFLPNNPVIIEAGGRHGEDTCRMKNVWPEAVMHVFEPWGPSFEKLTQATEQLGQVNRYQYALTTHSGTVDFYINEDNVGACSIGAPVDYNRSEFNETPAKVPCTTWDIWARDHAVNHVDFMWLDMEGHELFALQHASTFLSSVKAIYTEIDFIPVREGACLYTDLKKFLESKGFIEVWKSSNGGRFGDALFIKNHIVEKR